MADDNKQIPIELSPDTVKGVYSNLAVITHSNNEFVLDFASLLPAMPKALVCSRVIMTPENAKKLLLALTDNVRKYESQFGEIEIAPKQTYPFGGFGNNGGTKS